MFTPLVQGKESRIIEGGHHLHLISLLTHADVSQQTVPSSLVDSERTPLHDSHLHHPSHQAVTMHHHHQHHLQMVVIQSIYVHHHHRGQEVKKGAQQPCSLPLKGEDAWVRDVISAAIMINRSMSGLGCCDRVEIESNHGWMRGGNAGLFSLLFPVSLWVCVSALVIRRMRAA